MIFRPRPGLLLALLLVPVLARAAGEPLSLLTAAGRREMTPVVRAGHEMVPLEPLLQGLGVVFKPDARRSALTLSSGGREVTIYQGRNLASVGGELRLLTAAPLNEDGRWLVPLDSLPRIVQPLLNQRVEWRSAVRTIVIGSVDLPRITLQAAVTGELATITLSASRPVGYRVTQEPGRVLVAIPDAVVDVAFAQERLSGGIAEGVRFLGGGDNTVEITTGPRFQKLEAAEQENQIVLRLQAVAGPAPSPEPSGASPSPGTSPPTSPGGRARVVVIDPGHGGEDLGAQGAGGTVEKEISLAVARRLRNALANAGMQVFLTRDGDSSVGLDERTAIANNYKADVFVSIHANASRAQSARGSEVYFLSADATDDESRRVALLESGDSAGHGPVPLTDDLSMILWDMAQASHLAESAVLATRVQEELAQVTGSEGRGVKQAPFRVLVGAAMPAVLVELAFISNTDEEKLLNSDAYQSRVAAALVRGIGRFLGEREGALSAR